MNVQAILGGVLAVLLALLGWLGVEAIHDAEDTKDKVNWHCGWHAAKGEIDACPH